MAHALLRHLICTVTVFCAALQVCMGVASPHKTGIGIFDTLTIGPNASLGIRGDVYLQHAHVLGKGSLVIHGESQSKIISDHSEVNNLEIITYSTVSLEGELAVNQSLTVQCGSFDHAAGELNLSDSTEIHLLNGARMQPDTRVTGLPVQSGHRHSVDTPTKAILASYSLAGEFFTFKVKQQYPEARQGAWWFDQDVAFLPPEVPVGFSDTFY